MCVVTEEDWLNLRLQMPQRKGFSPLCVLQCAVKLAACEKLLLHAKHLYGRSPECVRMWVFNVLGLAYLNIDSHQSIFLPYFLTFFRKCRRCSLCCPCWSPDC